ncbi:MAG: hypothetical protein D6748_13260 [Calditrichaeota bacterium]|nr:MAG: hypothetical protein D6748_13260 [Calditrichota bacterium]
MSVLKINFPRLAISFFLLLLFLLFSCEHVGPIEPGLQANFTSIQENIFSQRCALSGCHVGTTAPFGLDLSEGKAYGNLVNMPSGEIPTLMRVKPNDPDNSYLVLKLEGDPRIQGQQMPFGGPFLTASEIEKIREWISEGAANN